jgi:hypothetical protein
MVEQGAPTVTQFADGPPAAVPIGHVLPVQRQAATERQQFRVLQLLNPQQYLMLGVGGFQRQGKIVQQTAEQSAIEQAQRGARLVCQSCSALAAMSSGRIAGSGQGRMLAVGQVAGRARAASADG